MRSWTYTELKQIVLNDLDLEDEDFISATEMLAYFNAGIDMVEAIIHNLYEDYFLEPTALALVNGTQDYNFPSTMYAHRVRKILYDNGSNKYEIRKIKRLGQIPDIQTGDNYRWLPIDTAASGKKIRLYPTSAETSSTNVIIWHIRNAKVLALDADVCDIPEFADVVVQFVKVRCYEKEGHPNTSKAMDDLRMMVTLMEATLTKMVDDENDELMEEDYSFYDDFDQS